MREELDLSTFDEPRLKRMAIKLLEPSFEIAEEVPGVYLVDHSTRVRIDYILTPRPETVAKGFVNAPIGLEVKSPHSVTVSGYALAWQAITYSQSEFQGERPAFVMVFPAWRWFFDEREQFPIRALVQYANVGELASGRYKHNWHEWQINFGPAVYYRWDEGLGPQPNAALKRRVGNC